MARLAEVALVQHGAHGWRQLVHVGDVADVENRFQKQFANREVQVFVGLASDKERIGEALDLVAFLDDNLPGYSVRTQKSGPLLARVYTYEGVLGEVLVLGELYERIELRAVLVCFEIDSHFCASFV